MGTILSDLWLAILISLENDQEFYMDFVKYVKPLLIFGHHLDPHFQQFEPLVRKFLVHKLS